MKQIFARLFRSACRPLAPAARRRSRGRLFLEALEDRAVPAAITVTLATDPLGAHTGTSLRDAIRAVDAGSDNVIQFNIPGTGAQVIQLQKALPALTQAVTIDGTTQPGYSGTPLIGLTPASSSVSGGGLRFTGGAATVEGLAIFGFKGFGLRFDNGGNNNVVSDYVGVTPGGTASGNGQAGVVFDHANNDVVSSSTISNNAHRGIYVDGSAHVTIGGTGTGNTISANGASRPYAAGIAILDGSWDVTVSNNTLTGNGRGIRVGSSGSTLPTGSNYSITVASNTIKGSTTQGVLVDTGSANVLLQGNDVEGNGLNPTGSSSATHPTSAGIAILQGSSNVMVSGITLTGNGGGIRVMDSGNTLPSGSTYSISLENNTITGNTTQGVLVSNSVNVLVGGTGAGNTVSSNGVSSPTSAGIAILKGSSNVMVSGNTLTGNGRGIRVSGSGSTLPTGSTYSIALEKNTIKGSTTQGVLVDTGSANVLLQGNDVENSGARGVKVDHSSNVAFTNNTVSSNGLDGILIGQGSQTISFSGNTIDSNKGYGVNILVKSVASPDQSNVIENNTLGNVHHR